MTETIPPQLFGPQFEDIWKRFDETLRKELLDRVRQLGSFYRVSRSREELSRSIGLKFYEALEHSLLSTGLLKELTAALNVPSPESFDDLLNLTGERLGTSHPLHAFMLLMIYLNQHPFRAFFSGRDERLVFNTLRLRIEQSPGDKLPTGISYGLLNIDLERCPGSALDVAGDLRRKKKDDDEDKEKHEHPRNHFGYIDPFDPLPPGVPIWYWHF